MTAHPMNTPTGADALTTIWLQVGAGQAGDDRTWSTDRQNDSDVRYVLAPVLREAGQEGERAAPAATPPETAGDMVAEVAAALELVRARDIVEQVRVLPIGGAAMDMPTQFHAGYQLACEEIAERLGGAAPEAAPAPADIGIPTSVAAAPAPAAPSDDTLQALHNELYRAQVTDQLDVQVGAIGRARVLLSRYRDAMAAPFAGDTVADRLDVMADGHPDGSQVQSDLYAAATAWRKHLAGPSPAQEPAGLREADAFPFYELRFIMRVLGQEGAAPKADWQTALGMATTIYRKWHPALAATPVREAEPASIRAALELYEGAFDQMFAQCLSNGMKDAWGRPVSCALLNEAHYAAGRALAAPAPKASEQAAPPSPMSAQEPIKPFGWVREQLEGKPSLDPLFVLGAPHPLVGLNGATYAPLYLHPAAPPSPEVEGLREDAERWRAFIDCARIRLFGWAGVEIDGIAKRKPGDNYVHFGGEFWTVYDPEHKGDPEQDSVCRRVVTAFADAARKGMQGGEAK